MEPFCFHPLLVQPGFLCPIHNSRYVLFTIKTSKTSGTHTMYSYLINYWYIAALIWKENPFSPAWVQYVLQNSSMYSIHFHFIYSIARNLLNVFCKCLLFNTLLLLIYVLLQFSILVSNGLHIYFQKLKCNSKHRIL